MPGTSSRFTPLREHSVSGPPDGAKADTTAQMACLSSIIQPRNVSREIRNGLRRTHLLRVVCEFEYQFRRQRKLANVDQSVEGIVNGICESRTNCNDPTLPGAFHSQCI